MIRNAVFQDAESIHNLIARYAETGKILFRSLEEIQRHIAAFIVYEREGVVVGACSLKPAWDKVAEIRSLAVHPHYCRQGIGTELVRRCMETAAQNQNEKIFVFTYAVNLFRRLEFDVVDKQSLPHKIWNDCRNCLHQEKCDETAMARLLPVRIESAGNPQPASASLDPVT
ncbi:MAG: GNAT family N-acetyltransferase [Nitrospinae bacterium CG11_big_fil_rev_8_21_14_0_20_56_8]|nr:MAG: GNAT family N-acetyltransferase [Nitrospinae bacterium CG11_big_fil_rev_8_21_14_0_20_56_8]